MSKLKKIIKKVAPVALPILGSIVAPGIGTAIGAGLGLSGTAAGVVGNALIGGATGALSGGGLKSALLGAATGGASSALSSSGIFGNAAGTALDKATGVAGMQGPTQGSGILGAATRGTSSLSSALRGVVGGGSGNISLSNAGTLLSGVNSYMTQDDLEKELLEAQGKAQDAIAPYQQAGLSAQQELSGRLAAGFDPGDLSSDPGYQYQLGEGQKALERSLAARGLGESGSALKAAMQQGQGLAATSYNDAYERWLAKNQQLASQAGVGYSAAGDSAGIAQNAGNVKANADVARSNTLSGTLSSILSGAGARKILYIDANGKPVYDTASLYGYA